LRRAWWLFFALALVSVIVGLLAIGAPHIATSKFVVVIGALLLIAGITEVIHAVMVRNLRGFAMHLLALSQVSLLSHAWSWWKHSGHDTPPAIPT
jgi:uncharacterized membrane protein HdeD (DUF308 family)